MWRVGLFDLLHRRRRFVLAVIATSLAFGLSLLMAGTIAHLGNETDRIVALFNADQFVVADGGTGPFTTAPRLLPASDAKKLKAMPGVKRADPFVSARENVKGKDVNVLGIVPNGLGSPNVHIGFTPNDAGQAVVDTTLGYDIGDQIKLGEHSYLVVGLTSDTTFYFGQPTVFLTVDDVQKNFLAGQPYVAIAVTGNVNTPPPGTQLMTEDQVRDELNRPQKSGTQTVAIFNTLLWLMAAGIVATMVYLTALERSRDIAVLKAMGAPNRTLFGGMAVQGLALALAACVVGALVSIALSPVMPFAVETPTSAYVQTLVIGVIVGLVAALVGLRRAVHIDPALAFGRQA